MVGCDNPSCKYQWFHLNCLGLKSGPKSKKQTNLKVSGEKEENQVIMYFDSTKKHIY